MATDLADWTNAVNIQAGTVTIAGTASVSIVGTPTVLISGTPTVNVGNTPAVTISSGTVNATISGTPNVNIQSQSVTVATNQPQKTIASGSVASGGTATINPAVDAGAHALILGIAGAGGTSLNLGSSITGNNVGQYFTPQSTLNVPAYVGMPWVSAVDTVANGTLKALGGTLNYWLVEVLDTQLPVMQASTDNPIVAPFHGPPVPVTLSVESAESQAGNSPVLSTSPYYGTLAAGASLVLASVIAGSYVHCVEWLHVTSGGTSGDALILEDNPSSIISIKFGGGAFVMPLHGLRGGNGSSVRLRNFGGAASANLTGGLLYVVDTI